MQHLGRLSCRSVSSVSSNANSFLFKFYSTETKKKIGFIGLGNMGRHQAANLLKNGYQVVVLDKSPDAVSALVAKGATSANTPKEIAEQADVIVTMLPASAHVKEVYSGKDGIFSAIKKGSLLLDSSTIDPSTARDVAKQAAEKGAQMIDCPVSGGVGGAEAGTLTFMVGGTKEAFEKAKEYLSAMGKNLVHCGDQGTGQVAKICNNLVLGISMIGVSEAMNLGVKNGMDPNILAGIFNTSTARCWSSDTYNPCPGVMPNVPSSRGYTGGFGSSLMAKDLGLAVEAAKTSGSTLGLGSEALKLYSLSSGSGYGNKDFSSMYEFLSQQPPKKEE